MPGEPLGRVAPTAPPRHRSVWNNRRLTLFVWQAAGLLAAAFCIAMARFELPPTSAWQIFTDTLAWSWLAALGSTVLLDALVARQPYLHFTVMLASVVVAFGVLFIGCIGTHATYSRWALVLALGFTLATHLNAWQRWRRSTTLRLGALDASLLERLAPASRFPSDAAFERCDWLLLDEATPLDAVDGLVLPDDLSATLRQSAALRAKLSGAQVYSESFVRSLLTGRLDIDRADAVFLDDVPTSFIYAAIKRMLDLAGTLVLMVFALPATLLSMLAIRLETPGRALLIQPRVGLRGRVFGMWKLRTMAERPGHAEADDDDPQARVTRVGRWLRRSRFDELPQLWNVLRGDMSLIGPRPEWIATAAVLEKEIPQFAFRYLVRPGITGWAQVHQGHVSDASAVRVKLEYDLYYAKNISLALDLAIGALTIRTVLTGRGAR